MSKSYQWERFWVSSQKGISLTAEGFLEDPEQNYGDFYNPHVVKFDTIKDKKCLILLGEPGIGKTNALELEKINVEREINAHGDLLIWLNLSIYNDIASLEKFLFDSKEFKDYVKSNKTLHIYLDGFDECKINIPQLIDYLFARIKDYPTEKLFIRIACRTAIWPSEANSLLEEIWDEANIGIFELVPLRKRDIEIAVQTYGGINVDVFIEKILAVGAGPLACRPITLNMLLEVFKEKQALPQKRSELYHQGCLRLVEELSKTRRRAKRTGKLILTQRLKIAAQIAMLMMLGNYSAIWIGTEIAKPKNSLSISDLCECLESSKLLGTITITQEVLEEVIDTGLFSSRDGNLMGWVHQTFAEYLSALALNESKLHNEKILNLLCNPAMENKIVPQLYETVAWLAELRPIIAHQILEKQPEIVIESDVLVAPGIDKARLVDNLLALAECNLLYIDLRKARLRYPKLNHDALAKQLAPYIEDPDKNENARSMAIDLAIACQLRSLQTILLHVALNDSDTTAIRTEAAYAVYKIADEVVKQKLKPLALGLAGNDPDDQLKSIALKALWPSDISAEELFTSLGPSKNSNLISIYSTIIDMSLANSFTAKDLPYALNWVIHHQEIYHLDYGRRRFIDAIMMRAWNLLEESGILDFFAKTAWTLVCQHERIFNSADGEKEFEGLVQNTTKRRLLVRAIIPHIKNAEQVHHLIWTKRLLYEEDIAWLLEILKQASNEHEQLVVAKMIARLAHPDMDISQINLLLEVCGMEAQPRHLILAKELKPLVDQVILNSEEANTLRNFYESMKKDKERRQPKLMSPPPEKYIEQALIKVESGEFEHWPQLLYSLSYTPEGQHGWVGDNVLEQPGWINASLSTRQRIIKAAACYLEKGNLNVEKLFNNTGTYQFDTVAAYPAFIILYNEALANFNNISISAWEKWAPLIAVYPFASENRRIEYSFFLQKAYEITPTIVLNAIKIQYNTDFANALITLDRIKIIWDENVAELLLDKLNQPNLAPNILKIFLRVLLEKKEPKAKDFALDIIYNTVKTPNENRENAVIAASLLIEHIADIVWLDLWPILQSDKQLGRAVFLMLVSTSHSGIKSFIMLSEYQIAEIYIWLEKMFPESEDPQYKGVHPLSPRDELKHFRNRLIAYLQDKGSLDACKALEKIAEAFSEKDWLHRVIFRARQITRNTTWLPLKPMDIIKFIKDEKSFLVRSEKELLNVIKKALDKIQERFQGETSEAFCVWDETSKAPVPEGRLSDYIKARLDDYLKNTNIIINREVEISNFDGKRIGERLDIKIEAIAKNDEDQVEDKLTVVIEVKGCWNKDLMIAMQKQLKDNYLDRVGTKTGLYLVGWYYCDRWTENDYRKRDCRRVIQGMSLDDLKRVLDEQASKLSNNDISINSYILNITY